MSNTKWQSVFFVIPEPSEQGQLPGCLPASPSTNASLLNTTTSHQDGPNRHLLSSEGVLHWGEGSTHRAYHLLSITDKKQSLNCPPSAPQSQSCYWYVCYARRMGPRLTQNRSHILSSMSHHSTSPPLHALRQLYPAMHRPSFVAGYAPLLRPA